MKQKFLAGLIVLLPLVITYWIIRLIVSIITGPFDQLATSILQAWHLFPNGFWIFSQEQLIHIMSTIFILISLTILLIVVGAVARWVVFHMCFHMMDRVLHALPFVNKIYLSCKDFTSALFSPKSGSFNQVVLVPFPSAEHRSIGLITNEFSNPALQDSYISVLVPGTPNPTVGFLLMFRRSQVTLLDMRVDEALKFVMSCGTTARYPAAL